MADSKGRQELGGMGSAMGGPDTARMQSLDAPSRSPSEGDPHDVEASVQQRLAAQGIETGSEDFDAITGESPHVGPTAGGG